MYFKKSYSVFLIFIFFYPMNGFGQMFVQTGKNIGFQFSGGQTNITYKIQDNTLKNTYWNAEFGITTNLFNAIFPAISFRYRGLLDKTDSITNGDLISYGIPIDFKIPIMSFSRGKNRFFQCTRTYIYLNAGVDGRYTKSAPKSIAVNVNEKFGFAGRIGLGFKKSTSSGQRSHQQFSSYYDLFYRRSLSPAFGILEPSSNSSTNYDAFESTFGIQITIIINEVYDFLKF